MMKFSRGLTFAVAVSSILLLQSCGVSNPTQNYSAGKQSFINGDYQTAFKDLQPLAKQGNPDAQYAVGYMYYYGLGTPIDRSQAIHWMQMAANNGQPLAKEAMQHINTGSVHLPYRARSMGSGRSGGRAVAASGPAVEERHANEGSTQGQGLNSSRMMSHWPPPSVNSQPGAVTQSHSASTAADVPPVPSSSDVVPATSTPAASKPSGPPTMMRPEVSNDKGDAKKVAANKDAKPAGNAETHTTVAKAAPAKAPATAGFTVQLMASQHKSDAQSYAKNHHIDGGVEQHTTNKDGHEWYVLTYGQFNSMQEAKDAIKQLPDDVRAKGPWVRSLAAMDGNQASSG
tara:strand:- start:7748 stop:8776 length:1029 start_codon:yes stop_codon:yes gene_type:complete